MYLQISSQLEEMSAGDEGEEEEEEEERPVAPSEVLRCVRQVIKATTLRVLAGATGTPALSS